MREKWIDNIKGIAIIMVMLMHSSAGIFGIAIANFFMPVFFFISGYTFRFKNDISVGNQIKKKFNRLIIPYINFTIILYVIYICKEFLFGQISLKKVFHPIIGAVYSRFYLFDSLYIGENKNIEFFNIWNGPLWFLTCLFCVYVIFIFIIKVTNNNKIEIAVYSMAMVCIGIIISKSIKILLPWSLDTAFVMVGFMAIGNLFSYMDIRKIYKVKYFIASSIFYIALSRYNLYANVSIRIYGDLLILFLAGFCGIMFWIYVCRYVEKYKIISNILGFLGQNTMVILSFHYIIFKLLDLVFKNLSINISMFQGTIIYGVIYALLTTFILIPIIKIINSKFSFLLGL